MGGCFSHDRQGPRCADLCSCSHKPPVQGDDSTPTILREGPLTVALKSAHHDGAETEVQQEERASSFDHASDAETTRLVGVCRYRNAFFCCIIWHLSDIV